MDEQYFFLDEKITSHTNTEQPINTMSDLNTHETKDLITTVLQNKDFLIVFCSTLVWGMMMMMLMFKTNTIDELTSEVKEYSEIVNHITTEADDLKDELESLSKYKQQLESEVSKLQKQVKTLEMKNMTLLESFDEYCKTKASSNYFLRTTKKVDYSNLDTTDERIDENYISPEEQRDAQRSK
jgi:septal ring factor EnvC (AmiA/AmiB activator)